MPESLTVTSNSTTQQPAGTDSSGSTLQQTRDSESLGVHTDVPAAPSNQDDLMAFLRSESAGPTHEANANKPSVAHAIGLTGVIVVCIIIAGLLLVFYKKLFTRRLHTQK